MTEERRKLMNELYAQNCNMTIGAVRGNSVWHKNAVMCAQDFLPEEFETLFSGEELLVDDETGERIFWEES